MATSTRNSSGARDSYRLPVNLPPAARERLERLEQMTGASSMAQVIRDALKLYDYLTGKREEGYEIKLVKTDQDDRVEELVNVLF